MQKTKILQRRSGFFELVSGTLILIGWLWVTSQGIKAVWEAYASNKWPRASGIIETSTVTVSRGRGTSYSPRIVYRYQANGEVYHGTEIAPGCNWDQTSAYRAVNTFSEGRVCGVFFDPTEPGTSMLLPGLHRLNFSELGLSPIIATVGIALVLTGYWKPRYGRPGGRFTSFEKGSPPAKITPFVMTSFIFWFALLLWITHSDLPWRVAAGAG